ncbi:MAG: discoidin domain-containing protein [Sedimentisphaerales bacterium]|nr:discoidin domain-containing protein [Sedimentisphaerales bacterium]
MKDQVIRSIAAATAIIIFAGCRGATDSKVTTISEQGKEEAISLAGRWSFKLDPNDVGQQEKWYADKLDDSIELPGSTAENGYGDNPSVDTKWTGQIVDKSWFTEDKYEKYRQPGNIKIPFWLTPAKHYVGPAWYQKQIDVSKSWSGKRIVLMLERCHWETKVWVDAAAAGMQDSLCTPQLHDLSDLLTPGRHTLTIRVDNSVKYDVGVNAHSVSDHTQSNWNGITGCMELQATDRIWVSDIQVFPDIHNKSAGLLIAIGNKTNEQVSGTLTIAAKSWNAKQSHAPAKMSVEFTASEPEIVIEVDYPMGDDVLLWDEFSPAMYRLTVSLKAASGGSLKGEAFGDGAPQNDHPQAALEAATQLFHDEKTVNFGMREFGTKGTQFTINNRLTFLRGTLECCIFPLTGYPPTNVEDWLREFRIAKAYGLNHIRFHSWCPPEAAFEAADRLGIMFHIECPAWTTIGDGKPIDKFIYAEGDRILKAYGNHPSFCMLAYGNEPGGRNQKRFLGDLVNYWKAKDPRRLYTSAAGWPIIPENQYDSTPAPRGHQWGAGLSSRFNAKSPETATDYSNFVKEHDVPIVSHEIGQWCVYPNFKEIPKYKGMLRPLNFEIFRDSLATHHMLDEAQDFLMASGKLQAMLYKQEIESALRTPGFGGFQLLDIHDFPGQGTALVGILDPFWDSKGYVEAKEHHQYCCETVPLVRMKKRTWTIDETFVAEIEIAHFGPASISNAVPVWSVNYSDGRKLASERLARTTIPLGNGIKLGTIEVNLANAAAPAKLVLKVSLEGTSYANSWDIWVYPAALDTQPPNGVLIAELFDEKIKAALKDGAKVLLIPPLNSIDSDVPPAFTTIFWNTQWTGGQPPHTLGILCDPKHPALAQFPTESHSNWQWWDIVTKSKFMILNELPAELRPIVQVIDDWNTNRRLGIIFEARIGKGKLLVSSIDLENNLNERPVARQMLHSLLKYMDSKAFAPKSRIDAKLVQGLFRKLSLLSTARLTMTDSEAPGFEARNVIDGNPNTIWHTPWGDNAPVYPHEFQIELPENIEIKGFTYLPRQEMANGWINKYEVYVSPDGQNWGQPAVTGQFAKDRNKKKVLFEKIREGRFFRFVALSGFDGQIFASMAELDIIPASEE